MKNIVEIAYKRQPKKYLNAIDAKLSAKLLAACEDLVNEKGDIVKLTGSRYYRLKLDKYRIIFTYDSDTNIITIEEINTRTNIKYRRWQ